MNKKSIKWCNWLRVKRSRSRGPIEGWETDNSCVLFWSWLFCGLFQVEEVSKSGQLKTPGCVKLLTISEGGCLKSLRGKWWKVGSFSDTVMGIRISSIYPWGYKWSEIVMSNGWLSSNGFILGNYWYEFSIDSIFTSAILYVVKTKVSSELTHHPLETFNCTGCVYCVQLLRYVSWGPLTKEDNRVPNWCVHRPWTTELLCGHGGQCFICPGLGLGAPSNVFYRL